jgi:hypothetical protein
MKSDAKLGLIAGVIGVITIAVVYYHKPEVKARASSPATSPAPSSTPKVPLAAVSIPGTASKVKNNNEDLD